jgi:mono/diheme cytochrome c family protein
VNWGLGRPFLWHNGAEGERVNLHFRFRDRNQIPQFRRLCTLSLSLIAAMVFAAPAPRAQNAASPGEKSAAAQPGNAETGKKTFTKDGCYECHGREGQGAAQGAGPRIGPPQLSLEAFIKYVHEPAGQMPPYTSKVLSDQELVDIYAYLQSRPKATPSKDIPLLNQ